MIKKKYLATFFHNGFFYEVEYFLKMVKGEQLFLFRNKFIYSSFKTKEIFLVNSGTNIAEEQRA